MMAELGVDHTAELKVVKDAFVTQIKLSHTDKGGQLEKAQVYTHFLGFHWKKLHIYLFII
jgi:hypothetical protein